MQIKTALRFRLTPLKMATMEKSESHCWGEQGEKDETLFTAKVQINTAIMQISLDLSQNVKNRTTL